MKFITNAIQRKIAKIKRKRQAKRDKQAVKQMRRSTQLAAVQKLFPDLVVQHGPFKGMKYPSPQAVGSALVPKLLGSYERELHPTIEYILTQDYTEIVDIGCAEGYYAVGMAIKHPNSLVYAFDTNEKALKLCRQMAELNGVVDRIVFGSHCSPQELRKIPYRGKALIISDCEGYEKELFSEDVIPYLAEHDLLIEIHDTVDITISGLMRERFSATHQIEVVESIDDIKKAKNYDYDELADYDLTTRHILISEGRGNIMEWFFLKSKSHQDA